MNLYRCIGRLGWVTATVFLLSGLPAAQEHAEHPEGGEAKKLTKDDIAEAVIAFVDHDSRLRGGHFVVFDEKAGEPLALKMEKVHRDRLSQVADGVYFVCADFTALDGTVYDLDIFMKGPDKSHLEATEITVHKESGVERYNWYEEGGIWKKRMVGGGKEHPHEHPEGEEHPEDEEHPEGEEHPEHPEHSH